MEVLKLPSWNKERSCFNLPKTIPEPVTLEMIYDAQKILISCAEDIRQTPSELYVMLTTKRIKNETRFSVYTLTLVMIQKHGPYACECLSFLFGRQVSFFKDTIGPARKASIMPVQIYKTLLKDAADEVGVDFRETHKTNLYRGKPDKSALSD